MAHVSIAEFQYRNIITPARATNAGVKWVPARAARHHATTA